MLRHVQGRLAQWERASFTPRRSLVQIQYRPPLCSSYGGRDRRLRGCGRSSVVEHLLPKQKVASSNLVARSTSSLIWPRRCSGRRQA